MLAKLRKFNAALALRITEMVGSMWCAYAFTMLACISFPQALQGGTATLIAWIAQTFLQLVLLSVIMVGQDVNNERSEARAKKSYDKSEARAEKDHVMITEQFHMIKATIDYIKAMNESQTAEMVVLADMHKELHIVLKMEREEKKRES